MKSFKSIVIVGAIAAIVTHILLNMVGITTTADNFLRVLALTVLANLGFMWIVDMVLRIHSTRKELTAKMDAIQEMNRRTLIEVRPVCGALDESMGKAMKYVSLMEFVLDTCFKDEFDHFNDISKFTTKHQGYDDRINWDTWVIMYDGNPIAYSNGELK